MKHLVGFSIISILATLILGLHLHAAPVFFDDFEDGNHDGWPVSSSGSGSTGVEEHNGSLMTYVRQVGSGSSMLSHDFAYVPEHLLSFDMHAVAYAASRLGYTAHAGSGAKVVFLDKWNSSLGSVSFMNTSNPATLESQDKLINDTQHPYQETMSEFAALAGLGPADEIHSLSLKFWA